MVEEEMTEESDNPDGISVHPETLTDQTPSIINNVVSFVIEYVSSYGWFLLVGSIVCLYVWKNLQSKVEDWRETAEHHKNPDKFVAREMSVSAARSLMQEKYDEAARERSRKLKEKEEDEKRNVSTAQSSSVSSSCSSNARAEESKSAKPKLRPAFNPMMGDTSSCAWRPGGGGGGGRRSGGG